MGWTVFNQKRAKLADLRRTFLNGLTLRLFKNNHAPSQGDTEANYTQADFPGYADVAVTGFGTAGFLNGSNNGEVDCAAITFTCTASGAGNNIYGAVLLDADGKAVCAQLDPAAPVAINTLGQQYTVNLVWEVGSLC